MESLIGNVLSFVIGAIASGGAFILLNFIQNRRQEAKEKARHEIVRSVGKLCSAVDSGISSYKLSRISLAALRDTVFSKLDEISETITENSDTLDYYFVKHIERFLDDKKALLSAEGIVPLPVAKPVPVVASVKPIEPIAAPVPEPFFAASPEPAAAVTQIIEPAFVATEEFVPPPAPVEFEPIEFAKAIPEPEPEIIAPEFTIDESSPEEYAFEASITRQSEVSPPPPPAPKVELHDLPGLVSMQTQVMDFSTAMANETVGNDPVPFASKTASDDSFNFEPVTPAPAVVPAKPAPAPVAFPNYDAEATQEFSFQDVRRMAKTQQDAAAAKASESDLVTGDDVMGQLDNIFSGWGK